MPGTWPNGDDVGGADDDDNPLAVPVDPDDRLWRHPSEVAWDPAPSAAGWQRAIGRPGRSASRSLRALAVTSALVGAVAAVGLTALVIGFGGTSTERVVERVGVRDLLADPLALRSATGLALVAEEVAPSVVRLEVETERGRAVGAGVVLLDDGHIVTNAHVVSGARTIHIVLTDGRSVGGEVVGVDEMSDLAVVAPTDDHPDVVWTPAIRGSAGEIRLGDPAVVVGPPQETGAPILSLGMVTGLGQWVAGPGRTLQGMIGTDVPIADRASGGALCDRTGRVFGITTSRSPDETTGTGFATPIEAAWATVETLMADGEVQHVWLGIQGIDLISTTSTLQGVAGSGGGALGIVVARVLPSSPAAAAGLHEQDVLIALDDAQLSSMGDLIVALRGYQPGDDATITVLRGGVGTDVTVTFDEREG